MSLHTLPVGELREKLDSGALSAVELAQSFLARIESSTLNAFIDVRPDLTLAQASAADARLAAGERSPLLGIPIAHKDIFVTQGWRSTAGSRMLADYVSPFDASVVTRLQAAGAVCLGKTNCDEFAMGSANENSYFGPVHNPWDPKAIPGGSSGGSAAAVAADLAPLATGTDTGGSVRQPASMCGITGIKPTYGRVSRFGMIAYASSLDQGGAMGRSASECALLLSAMSGFDERDSTSIQKPPEDFGRELGRPLAGLRIGLPREFFGDGLAADVRAPIEAALAELRAQGAVTVDVSLPRTALAIPAYYVIAPAEASSNLSRFDGVRYGRRASQYTDLADMYARTRAEGFGPEVKRRILVGAYVLSHGYYDAYYLQAQKLRRLIADDFSTVLDSVDVIAGPVSPTVAWNLGEHSDDPVRDYLADIFTLPASLAGLPGLSMPVGLGAGGRPVGMQLIGRVFDEARLLNIAHRYQQATDWHTRRPGGAV
ncbi:MAG: Asp-tRNA(Asn)/Glu-tRNA(Gln) amidotransferase subunit GatA [Burkholderiaceae bacterium]|jgi:aspartyl-tRNA(Asn)/glutamyl-tRNA(Gln) amidotransferase subunit A|nr:Asp-tRNA(Asn)/Glu-tRNA(Gln) amidotransferase subunit GatA [Burkholderiaceae bacterium]